MVIFKMEWKTRKNDEENILVYHILCSGTRIFFLTPGKRTKSNGVN